MKALSIDPVYAMLIFAGQKTIECRTWKTDYRGDILICSTKHLIKDTIPSHALCVVRLADVVPFEKKHLDAACMEPGDYQNGRFAWLLEDLRIIRPFAVKGKLSLWECDHEIEIIPEPETDEEDERLYHEIWEPLFT